MSDVVNSTPIIYNVFEAAEKLSEDEKNRRLAQMREDALRNKLSELSAARKKGWQAGWREGWQEEKEKGREEGIRIGELIGQIQVLQRILKRPISSKEALITKDETELQNLFQELEQCLTL